MSTNYTKSNVTVFSDTRILTGICVFSSLTVAMNALLLLGLKYITAGKSAILVFTRSLCIGDLLIGAYGIFQTILLQNLEHRLINCFLPDSIFISASTTICLTLLWLNVDCYLRLTRPLGYGSSMDKGSVIIAMLLVWNAGFVIGFLPQIGWNENQFSCNFFHFYSIPFLVITFLIWLLCIVGGIGLQIRLKTILARIQRDLEFMSHSTLLYNLYYQLVLMIRTHMILLVLCYVPYMIYIGFYFIQTPFHDTETEKASSNLVYFLPVFVSRSCLSAFNHSYRIVKIHCLTDGYKSFLHLFHKSPTLSPSSSDRSNSNGQSQIFRSQSSGLHALHRCNTNPSVSKRRHGNNRNHVPSQLNQKYRDLDFKQLPNAYKNLAIAQIHKNDRNLALAKLHHGNCNHGNGNLAINVCRPDNENPAVSQLNSRFHDDKVDDALLWANGGKRKLCQTVSNSTVSTVMESQHLPCCRYFRNSTGTINSCVEQLARTRSSTQLGDQNGTIPTDVELSTSSIQVDVELSNGTFPAHVELSTNTIPAGVELSTGSIPTNVELSTLSIPTNEEFSSSAFSANEEFLNGTTSSNVELLTCAFPENVELSNGTIPSDVELSAGVNPTDVKVSIDTNPANMEISSIEQCSQIQSNELYSIITHGTQVNNMDQIDELSSNKQANESLSTHTIMSTTVF